MSRKLKPDFTQVAFRIGQKATHQEPPEEPKPALSPKAASGRKGGLKGGVARTLSLSPEQRSALAKAAAKARWEKAKKRA